MHDRLRNYFGSSRHVSVAMFKKQIKDLNNGIPLCFIKIVETCMGGKIINLLRLLRLRDLLIAHVEHVDIILLLSSNGRVVKAFLLFVLGILPCNACASSSQQ